MACWNPREYCVLDSPFRGVLFPRIYDEKEDSANECLMFTIFQKVIDSLAARYGVDDDEVQSAIKHLMFNYGRVSKGSTPDEPDFNNKIFCMGYLHRYASNHAVLVFRVMKRAFEMSRLWDLKCILDEERMNLVCLGSGPGNDFFGFLNALWTHSRRPKYLDVTIVDKMLGWKIVLSELIRNMGNGERVDGMEFNNVDIRVCFIQINLISQLISGHLMLKMNGANIVLLVKFLSIIPDSDKLTTLQKIVDSMRPDALLVYIDHPYPRDVFSALRDRLYPVYERDSEKFTFYGTLKRFGYHGISSSRAAVKIFAKRMCV